MFRAIYILLALFGATVAFGYFAPHFAAKVLYVVPVVNFSITVLYASLACLALLGFAKLKWVK